MRFFLKVSIGLIGAGSVYILYINGQYLKSKNKLRDLETQLVHHECMYLAQQKTSRWHEEPVQRHLSQIWKLKAERLELIAQLKQMKKYF